MSIADRRERDKQARRDSIVDAAEKLFFSKGFAPTTIDEIAAAAELSKGTIYLYFKNKEEIYIAIIRRGLRLLINQFHESAAKAGTGAEKVRSLGQALLTFYERYPDHFKAMFYQHEGVTCPAGTAGEDPLISGLLKDKEEIHAFSMEVIQGGIDDGSIRPEVDPVKATLVLIGMILGLIRMASVEEQFLVKRFNLSGRELIQAAFEMLGRPVTDIKTSNRPEGPADPSSL